ncbi:MAG: bifunctional folylpolyglutamate synthase/dihydrofolate synthase [Thermodesulfobacteriota bacterium]
MPLKKAHLPGSSYQKTIDYLYGMKRFDGRMGLTAIKELLSHLGEPQRAFPVVHIGGSNGKGSTSVMVASMLREAGYRVGLYTSPHLVRFNERIRIGRREIPNRRVVELTRKIASRIESAGAGRVQPTFFEFTTALAFLYFAESDIDIAVIEVGMGGRLDATNVVAPLVSVITNVSREHEAVLGNGIRAVAREKAGIIRMGVPLVTASKGVALNVLREICLKRGASLYSHGRDFGVRRNEGDFSFVGTTSHYRGLRSVLDGQHQRLNAACAIMAVELLRGRGFPVGENGVRRGLASARWPGRMEVVRRAPTVVIDCAHNPAGAMVLRNALEEFTYRRLLLVLGVMADKDIGSITSRIVPLADRIIVTRAQTERAATVDALREKVARYGKPVEAVEDVAHACEAAMSRANDGDLICIAGSIFIAGEARRFMMGGEVRGRS